MGLQSNRWLINDRQIYDFPLLEKEKKTSLKELREAGFNGLNLKNKVLKTMGNEYKHILSHQVILARFIHVDCKEDQLAAIQKDLRIESLIPI